MKNIFVTLLTLFSVFIGTSQTKLFSVLPGKVEQAKQATLLKLDPDQLRAILDANAEELELQIPFNGTWLSVSLQKNNPFREDFHVDTDVATNVAYTPGLYYRGKNASLNFFEGEMNGIVSLPNVGNLVIAPYKGNYIIYNDATLTILNDFDCKFEDPKPAAKEYQITTQATTVAKCASVYLEVDNTLYVNKGTLTATMNFVTSLFNNVQTLFANSGITVALKSTYVWTTSDPYTGTTSSAQLANFHTYRPTFDGDLGQLIAMDSGNKGGIAAAVMGVCSSSNYSYVDIDPGFNVIPTYSWSVQGMTHELGHLLGSPHTHACAWNGNNTPIDGCGSSLGYTEGSCATGVIPPALGGTIMSYCHLVSGVGINFANGFGAQPTERILSTMSGATCLSATCASTATCTNGVTAVNVTAQTTTSLSFSWTDAGGNTSWQVGVFTMAGSGSYTTVSTPSFTKTGLTANTFYKIRILPVCTSGQTLTYSEFVQPTAADWCSGVSITDSGGTLSTYTANENYTRILTPSTGNNVKITFSVFNLESAQDYLYVYNGTGTTSLIGAYTGATLPTAITSTASNGALTIKFTSTQTVQNAGFVAAVSCVPVVTTVTCTTNTTWNGSVWSNGTPSSTKSAIIAGKYTAGTAFTCCNLIINSGATLTIASGKNITVMNNITINGSLVVQDKGQLIQVSDAGVNTGTGKFSRTTPSLLANDYVYWSSPTTNTTLGTGIYGWYNYATFTTANFSDVQTINASGVVTAAVADGMDDNNNVWTTQASTVVMIKGKGYIARNPTSGIKTKDFVGTPTNGVVQVPLSSSGNILNRNYNLVGNPYPSSINANLLIQANTGTTGTLYFWTHKTAPVGTAPGGVPGNYAGLGDFSAYSLTGGIASESGSAVPTGTIPSHQGFFVDKTTASAFTFNNSMRSATLVNSNFLRQRATDRFWVSLTDDSGLFRQSLIGYLPDTNRDADWGYDSQLMQRRAQADFYSLIDDNAYCIQSRGDFNEDDEVPMGFSSEYDGTFSIQIDDREGVIEEVYLFDAVTGKWNSLDKPYEFTSDAGIFDQRFRIGYNKALEIETDEAEVEPIKVYPNPTKGILNVSGSFETYELYDLYGKRLKSGTEKVIDISELPIGMYLLRIDNRNAIKVVRS
ncbi:M12 family metallo-peptidase [Flavobacterium silvaticum]|uniref:T9SS type A sorting domain-containing protein n=1 Tax=Flavobacterium silvaticum TaxID=1852020 RepID=A0A972G1B4_9FLAO|nr:M12 family metallo-peptidase [Flavobacterium silvaticum]NMH28626.1 T9SS type A sorting domain-containing protein [Flavobacterium silvaticum]